MLVPAHRRPHPPTHPPTIPSHRMCSLSVDRPFWTTTLCPASLLGAGWASRRHSWQVGTFKSDKRLLTLYPACLHGAGWASRRLLWQVGYACRSISSVWGSDLKCAAIWWGMAGSGWAEGHPGLLVSGSRTGCTSLTLLLVSAHLLALPPPSLPPLRSRPGPARWFAHHPPVAPTHHTPLCSSLFAVFFGFAFLALKYVSHVRR